MIGELRDFIAKDDTMDLAVGIIGAAFAAIVNSLVADVVNPVLGLLVGGLDVSNLYWVMAGEARCPRPRAWPPRATRRRRSSPPARS
jgi:large conductance mechanosensitive channel